MGFHKLYPYVTLNIMEAINFVAENSLEDNSIDLTIYNVHKFPENMDYQILREEEIVLVLNKNHPLCEKAQPKEGFRHPWLDLKMLEKENFILLYPDQNTGGIAQSLFKEYSMEPTVLLHTRNSAMSIRLAIQGLGAAFAPESYFREESRFFPEGCCFSIGQKPVLTTTIVAYQKKKYLSQHARDYVEILKEYATSLSVSKGNDI